MSKAPPSGVPVPVVEAILTHRPLAEWIVYQGEMCKRHGCIQ